MGPKKDNKKAAPKNDVATYSIEDPINTDSWKCVVVMAVERTIKDSFVLKEFVKESKNMRRHAVRLIDFDILIMDILNQFASGTIAYKYAILMNFSSIFQEAVSYVTQKLEVPVVVLVKVVKAVLFYLKEESIALINKMAAGAPDPIKAMAERETATKTPVDTKKKEVSKKVESRIKLRPQSATKEDTQLLKRGEAAKLDQRIDDAPKNGYFSLYVLLTGFYKPNFPLELIKAGVPLYGLICIDSSLLGLKKDLSSLTKFQKRDSADKAEEITNFWRVFLKILWDSESTFYFRNTVFQVYMPPKFFCDEKKFRELIYREISYLLYDLSDLKKQLYNYLDHLKLWNVDLKWLEIFKTPFELDSLPNDCITVPVVLQYIVDAITEKAQLPVTTQSLSSNASLYEEYEGSSTPPKLKSCEVNQAWSKELIQRGEVHLLQAWFKTKDLDIKYDMYGSELDSSKTSADTDFDDSVCDFQTEGRNKNMEEAFLMSGGRFAAVWNKYKDHMETTYDVDYCLYSLFMTRVFCSYQNKAVTSPTRSCSTAKKTSDSDSSESISEQALKPRFTITEGSRTILGSIPGSIKQISRDFFCPHELKVVNSDKLKASSAFEFRITPNLKIQNLFMSEIFSSEPWKNPYECLRGFVNENLFSGTNNFDFVEFLNKPKLLQKERDHWDNYNCIDHAYSFLDDSIFFMMHNRKDGENVHHETFNVGLKTFVGFRDFYDYVMEDESEWLKNQEELRDIAVFLTNRVLENDSFKNITNSEFWLADSLKFQYVGRTEEEEIFVPDIQTAPSVTGKSMNKITIANIKKLLQKEELEAYDVSEMAVQFSGLKTVYYANDSNVAVQLIERLYGNQDLGVHVSAACNTLHLHSYVCPEPHILDPFTFHITYKSGIIVAFGRRFVESTENIEESVETLAGLKVKKNSLESPEPVVKNANKLVKDDEYLYDMVASLPNGLSIGTVRKVVKPCYIKQHYLTKSEETAKVENSRLFLPNGNVVKMMANDTIEILKIDTSFVTANLTDLIDDKENPSLAKFTFVSGEGYYNDYENGRLISSNRMQIFQNTDLETKQIYTRRRDGTNYVLQNDGTLCMQFRDGTRMCSTVLEDLGLIHDTSSSSLEEVTNPDYDFVFVNLEITAEHPDYATVIYNTLTQKWKILLPYDSTITIEPNGCYSVDIDKQTELRLKPDLIEMERFSPSRESLSIFTADLSAFENPDVSTYCQMKDSTGKTFILDRNSNYRIETLQDQIVREPSCKTLESDQSELMASTDLEACIPSQTFPSNRLIRANKYFVVKRDVTGVELLHKDDVNKELTEGGKGTLVYTLDIPDKHRCFVQITPNPKKTLKKWEVETILPNPKYNPNPDPKTTSSTYGDPPSWMHPFPKKKTKFIIPYPLACRVFVETTKTDITPKIGTLDQTNCEIEEISQINYSNIPPKGIKEFLRKLSNDDQDILKEMYTLALGSLIQDKKKQKPVNSEKLQHYLKMSKYYVELREYHKNCIRYNIIPNYFHHPKGMSWLILNDLLLKMTYPDEQYGDKVSTKRKTLLDGILSSDVSEFSNEEIEYNLPLSAGQSFSDLSFRSGLSTKTAPGLLQTGGVCKCKVRGMKHPPSSPNIKYQFREQTFMEDLEKPDTRICNFEEKDIEKIEMEYYGKGKTLLMCLEDLMHLGLV